MPLVEEDCTVSYKILIIGDTTVGKTAILRALVGRDFQERTRPTVGKRMFLNTSNTSYVMSIYYILHLKNSKIKIIKNHSFVDQNILNLFIILGIKEETSHIDSL